MSTVLLQKEKPIFFHFEAFSKEVSNYPKHDKESYASMESVKQWKHYLMGK